jgi:hypothetical protein
MGYLIIGTLILSLISPIFYTKSMLAGKAKPHKVTRFIVWLASIAGVLGVIHHSNLPGRIYAYIFLARATYLLIMSLKFGFGGFTKLDKYCLVLGVVAVISYVLTGNGLLSISLGILADVIGYIPTFIKVYLHPKSEDPTFFSIEAVAALFGIFAIWQLKPDILFPIYFTLCSAVVVGLIYRKKLLRYKT